MPSSASSASAADHPRPRGVYGGGGGVSLGAAGSSPPARGLRAGAWCPPRWCRIIPARAGFTLGWACRHRLGWDHPRPRGVYSGVGMSPPSRLGSSPPARGLRGGAAAPVECAGIIPARAGFTIRRRWRRRCWRDHPRPRGVYPSACQKRVSVLGSSPPARGLRRSGGRTRLQPGIIPARAGFTRRHLHPARRRRGIIPARAGFTRRPLLGWLR